MKRRTVALILVLAMLCAIPVYAMASVRLSNYSVLSFNGTTANCSVLVTSENPSDRIVTNMRLKCGSSIVGEWNRSGYGSVQISGSATVVRNETYTLVVYVTINGVAQQPATITKTNN